jgi:peptidoglycan-N-acetylglucosamine deacetylase
VTERAKVIWRAVRAARAGVVFAAPRRYRRREIALTFDDGPSEWTEPILDLFGEHGSHATFFVLGSAIAGREATLRRAVAEGHEVGNHAFTHVDPATLPDDELEAEIWRTNELVRKTTGAQPRFFRPPYADCDWRVARVARRARMERMVLRSVDPADWNDPDADRIASQVLAAIRRGSIVCLHDALPPHDPVGIPTRTPTVDALRTILPALRTRGYRLVTVSELLA